ncbi:MAG: DUF642 domain-containing protein [Methanoregula sp.]|jgi:hypothetical protein|nr:DUF642 domain-containing protein [Methanoregula sp.]
MRKLVLGGLILLLLAGIGTASAATNLARNGGFEKPQLGADTGYVECPVGIVNDWVIGGAGIDHIRTYWDPSEGVQSIDLSRRSGGNISQAIPTTAGRSYTLSFDIAGNPEYGLNEKLLLVHWGSEPAYGPYTFTPAGYPLIGPGGWVTITIPGLPGSDGATLLTFEDVSTPSSPCGVALDNIIVTLDEEGSEQTLPVSEFPSLALPTGLIIGIIGSVVYIRNSREQ